MMIRLFCGMLAVAVLLAPGQALAAYADVVLTDNPVLYYQFEEAGSAVNSGSAGAAFDGTYNGGLALGTSPIGSSASFDGVDDYVYVPDTYNVLGGPGVMQFTFEAWVNTTSVDGDGLGRILQGQIPFADALYDGLGPDGKWRPSTYLYMNDGDYYSGDFSATTTKINVSLGEWHHLVLTGVEFEGSLYTKVYVDGNHVQTSHSKTATFSYISHGSELVLGGDLYLQYMHNGGLDEVAFYNTALSDERIQTHYLAAAGVPGDTDADGDVDAVDAAVLAGNWLAYNVDFTEADGDFNGDGWVDDLDASILAANWNPGPEAAGTVPEPSTWILLASLALGGGWFRHRRRT
ncbi:MAG: PEP-CTERM sorting domain-containing protein [Pirellulales bacterium]|nr:PEP-CTERM sorting domain-containing protein [Pirellulales bacterium]